MELSNRDITLIRAGLFRRMDVLKDNPECADSYARCKELLIMLFPLSKVGQGAILTPKE